MTNNLYNILCLKLNKPKQNKIVFSWHTFLCNDLVIVNKKVHANTSIKNDSFHSCDLHFKLCTTSKAIYFVHLNFFNITSIYGF